METSDPSELKCLEFGASRDEAELSIILMHGLGASAHDFEDVARTFCQAAAPKRWRFVLPSAPQLSVTVNQGMRMPAWYDILDMSHSREVNWKTVADSQKQIEGLIASEPAGKIILAGFSQGGAMALHVGLRNQSKIAGVVSMSGYLLESDVFPVPACEGELPIGLFHGDGDEVVSFQLAEMTREGLREAGFDPRFIRYAGLGHSVSQEELRDLFEWLTEYAEV